MEGGGGGGAAELHLYVGERVSSNVCDAYVNSFYEANPSSCWSTPLRSSAVLMMAFYRNFYLLQFH